MNRLNIFVAFFILFLNNAVTSIDIHQCKLLKTNIKIAHYTISIILINILIAEQFLFDEDLLFFENLPNNKQQLEASILDLGSGSPDGKKKTELFY